jgi:dTDP-4-dehydrorhamnose reductase
LRYPALWERISPDDPDEHDWTWTDERLPRIRDLGMNPIVTLCHHGSGPRYTSLLDEGFAAGLARHAKAVAERYPWVIDWTPVNEPLTTARFSALYGYWYPHTTDESAFWVALLNEIDATRLAMKAIREVNPEARLIQTDDLGYCHATPPLQHEADYQNERRWMGWDLLCGRVVPGHPLWERLIALGLEERLQVIAGDPCPPDIIGINHYLSSERLLDHRVHQHGHRSLADKATGVIGGLEFVDVDAIRHREAGVNGIKHLLREAWDRYRLPIAVTECHNGSTRDEQARWFVDVWRQAEQLREEGVDLRAVTVWSLLGAYDWNRMVTRFIGHYEPGVFDVRSGTPRPTLMARVLTALAAGKEPASPALHTPGWWRRSALIDGASEACPHRYEVSPGDPEAPPPLMIIGAHTKIGRLATLACEARGLHYAVGDEGSRRELEVCRPWALLDARERRGGTASAPRETGSIPCAVFADQEEAYLAASGRTLIFRCGPIFAPDEDDTPAARMLERLQNGRPITADAGKRWNGVYGPDAVDVALDLLLDGAGGVFDLCAPEAWSELDFARTLAAVAGYDLDRVRSRQHASHAEGTTPTPFISHLPPGETTIERFIRERRLALDGSLVVERRSDETRFGVGH